MIVMASEDTSCPCWLNVNGPWELFFFQITGLRYNRDPNKQLYLNVWFVPGRNGRIILRPLMNTFRLKNHWPKLYKTQETTKGDVHCRFWSGLIQLSASTLWEAPLWVMCYGTEYSSCCLGNFLVCSSHAAWTVMLATTQPTPLVRTPPSPHPAPPLYTHTHTAPCLPSFLCNSSWWAAAAAPHRPSALFTLAGKLVRAMWSGFFFFQFSAPRVSQNVCCDAMKCGWIDCKALLNEACYSRRLNGQTTRGSRIITRIDLLYTHTERPRAARFNPVIYM